MCCARRWARLKRQPPATRFAPRSIDCTNTQSGSKAPSFSPASSPCSSPRGRNLPSFRLAFRLRLLFFEGAPQIPACDRAVGAPALAVFKNCLRFGDVLVSVHPLETLSNSVVVCSQDLHGRDFLPRKSGAPQFRFGRAQNFFRSRKAAGAKRLHAPENCLRRFSGNLLVDDGLQQACIRVLRFAFLRGEASNPADHSRETTVRA